MWIISGLQAGGSDLEVEDSTITFWKALVRGHHTVQKLLIQGETSNSSQQPAVTWTQKITCNYVFGSSYSTPKFDFKIFSSAVKIVRKKPSAYIKNMKWNFGNQMKHRQEILSWTFLVFQEWKIAAECWSRVFFFFYQVCSRVLAAKGCEQCKFFNG